MHLGSVIGFLRIVGEVRKHTKRPRASGLVGLEGLPRASRAGYGRQDKPEPHRRIGIMPEMRHYRTLLRCRGGKQLSALRDWETLLIGVKR